MTRLEDNELAFEQSFPKEGDAPDLWRLSSIRYFKERRIRHVNWFAEEESALKHAEWIEKNGGKVLGITHYALVGLLSRQYLDLKSRHQQLEQITERMAVNLEQAVSFLERVHQGHGGHFSGKATEPLSVEVRSCKVLADYAAWKVGK